MAPTYWLNLFSYKTWQEFLAAGGEVTGFRDARWPAVQRIKPGDRMLCYLTGVSRWIGLLEVTGPAFQDTTPIWQDNAFAARLPVRPVITLEPETAVPILTLKDRLSIFQNLSNPHAWTGRLRGSPSKWKSPDGEAIVAALEEAPRSPVRRPFDPAKLARKSPILRSASGEAVTVPDDGETPVSEDAPADAGREATTAHTEIQWLLAKAGNDMGRSVWVARNDKGRVYNGNAFTSLPRLLDTLPIQFDQATTGTIELIDVLWLDGNSIQAAFEVESTTSIYSGLLRMADLIAMQPNLSIPLYLVAPDARREKVGKEIRRPTFSRLKPPLRDVCRYLPFEELRSQIAKAQPYIRHLSPDFLNDFAETFELEDD